MEIQIGQLAQTQASLTIPVVTCYKCKKLTASPKVGFAFEKGIILMEPTVVEIYDDCLVASNSQAASEIHASWNFLNSMILSQYPSKSEFCSDCHKRLGLIFHNLVDCIEDFYRDDSGGGG